MPLQLVHEINNRRIRVSYLVHDIHNRLKWVSPSNTRNKKIHETKVSETKRLPPLILMLQICTSTLRQTIALLTLQTSELPLFMFLIYTIIYTLVKFPVVILSLSNKIIYIHSTEYMSNMSLKPSPTSPQKHFKFNEKLAHNQDLPPCLSSKSFISRYPRSSSSASVVVLEEKTPEGSKLEEEACRNPEPPEI